MNTALVTSILGAISGVIVVILTYWAAKSREREADWRKEKISYYKAFIESLSGVVEGDASPEGHKAYAKATNNLLLLAPQEVIIALNAYRSENAISNVQNSTREMHDMFLAQLIIAIRKDIGISPPDNPVTFKPMLWSSGTSNMP